MQTLRENLEKTKDTLIGLVNALHENDTDRIPFEGSWTAGQLLEHVNKAVNPSILHGGTQHTDRLADEKVALVRKIFLDFDTKFQSPDFIVPTETVHDKNILLASLVSKFDELLEAVSTLELGLECTDFEVPGMGKFTRYEWIAFQQVHTQRHLQQLKNILLKLQEAA